MNSVFHTVLRGVLYAVIIIKCHLICSCA